jgi:hypothetical protein
MPTNTARRITVVGLPGMGKTVWTEIYAQEYIDHREGVLVVDPIRSFKNRAGVTIFHTTTTTPTAEVEQLLKTVVVDPYKAHVPLAKRYRLLILDEASRYYPHAMSNNLPEQIGYINDFNRHMDLTLVTVARRMTQLAVDFPELSHRLIIYMQKGLNDIRRLNNIQAGLGDAVEKLKKHEYIELDENREIIHHNPLQIRKKP